jgi:acetate kinase
MNDALLVINAGSSSIKFAVFSCIADNELCRFYSGAVDGIGEQTSFAAPSHKAEQHEHDEVKKDSLDAKNHSQALQHILNWLEKEAPDLEFVAAGHRVVHGGTTFSQATRIDHSVLDKLKELIALAPLHQPHALEAIEVLIAQRPHMPQVACFDTAFHASMPKREQQFALPQSLTDQGIRRYGFHGLSYEYIASVLPEYLGETANGKVVIAHLGHGVSMCALQDRKSVATTMSFTPLDGLPMGTRSGAIDPAVILYLLEHGMTGNEISDLLHHHSGLLGLSGISGDMRTLLSSSTTNATEAVDFFCYRISRELGSLTAALGGLDAVVFSGGIGEHAAAVRARICRDSAWIGVKINEEANQANALQISTDTSKVSVWAIPTDEEQMIARHTLATIVKA